MWHCRASFPLPCERQEPVDEVLLAQVKPAGRTFTCISQEIAGWRFCGMLLFPSLIQISCLSCTRHSVVSSCTATSEVYYRKIQAHNRNARFCTHFPVVCLHLTITFVWKHLFHIETLCRASNWVRAWMGASTFHAAATTPCEGMEMLMQSFCKHHAGHHHLWGSAVVQGTSRWTMACTRKDISDNMAPDCRKLSDIRYIR